MGFFYYEEVDSDDDDEEGVNIVHLSYVQPDEEVLQDNRQAVASGRRPPRAVSSNLHEQLCRLPHRMAVALGRMSANLNCYQPMTTSSSSSSTLQRSKRNA
ncbi:Hypothetical predicted protein [Drosophila guanche]|uniref:Uncharacterized protein n=1 Tax=Drosophila guanche TaxID=7266 RepID=A0A3B0JD53_DROGU|nr:Hypothetical predicted protein [Drosophila guanche]